MAAAAKKIADGVREYIGDIMEKFSEKFDGVVTKFTTMLDEATKRDTDLVEKIQNIQQLHERFDHLEETVDEQNKSIRANHARYLNHAESMIERMDLLDKRMSGLVTTIQNEMSGIKLKLDDLSTGETGRGSDWDGPTLEQITSAINKNAVDIKAAMKV